MRLPQISGEYEAVLDALRNKTRKAAAIKRLREILPQKARQRQSLERLFLPLRQPADSGQAMVAPRRQPIQAYPARLC
jgi:hypothetical protein